ncbi:helix-turn-helix transcriptional regulator [Actinoplanes sp. TBRC 11911]|uniref:helix-turn-helix domain-containing protein n=1 Tax=Actinoplanes sp. TBRC 11911 TaxID=2729386 RepID=UPI00145F16E6|nr:helix-turn-helix transcriptional regulator [Actinoplanes sp. TBRC 11911]NMO57162.1 helix-turn-helix transcriptional regulator [Actinoplanes sp. TBRC 11911]
MTEDVSPTVARRHLRLALREAREAANLTQLEVAEEMEWSLSKIIRIENGDVRISPNDLRPLLTLLNVKDKTTVADLLAFAKIARTRQRTAWYQTPEFRSHITDASMRLIEYEIEAQEIRYYQMHFMPGPLQTAAYTAANFAKFEDDEISAATRHHRAEARDRRRQTVLSRLGDLRMYALFDQSVFHRTLGGLEVFVEQLSFLLDLAVAGKVNVRMIPFDSPHAPLTNNATFELYTLRAGDPTSDVLYRETGLVDEIVEDREIARKHHERFDKIWRASATEEDTIDFMRNRIKELEAHIRDREST